MTPMNNLWKDLFPSSVINPALALRKHVVDKYRNDEVDLDKSLTFSSYMLSNNGFDKWDTLLQYIGSMLNVIESEPDSAKEVVDGILSTMASIDIVSDLNDYMDEVIDSGDTALPISKFCDKVASELEK